MFIDRGHAGGRLRKNPWHFALASAAGCSMLLGGSAYASLGEDATSVLRDQTALTTNGGTVAIAAAATTDASSQPTLATNTSNGYTIKTVTQTGGTRIHEYLGSDGSVFAIAWAGPFMPNLRQLLGTYFSAYQTAAAQQRANTIGRGPMSVDDGELVVQSSGGMHHFTGNAYLKSRLPGSLSVDLIR